MFKLYSLIHRIRYKYLYNLGGVYEEVTTTNTCTLSTSCLC